MTDRRTVWQAMAKLSSPQRAVIYQAYYLKHTTAQIAAEFNTPEHVVRSKLHDAMRELRRILLEAHAAV